MKVVTWNIWKGKYLQDVTTQLQSLNADIIALQEVTAYETDNAYQNIGQEIADSLGYQYVYCKSFTTDRHTPSFDQGNAVLSKYPITSSHCHFLSTLEEYRGNAETEPRTAVEVEVTVDSRPLSIISTHLGYTPDLTTSPLQMQQAEKLLNIANKKRCLIMGDFNSLPQSEVIKHIADSFINTDLDGTKPTRIEEKDGRKSEAHIDYIFCSPDLRHSDFTIHPTSASDHLPLSVVIAL